MAASPKRRRHSEDPERSSHVCQLCNKSYERADHLSRHLDSHRNRRTFKCSECPRSFNRRDLLLRHQATHAKNAANGTKSVDRTGERAIKACDPCVISKLKCDNTRPCQRCCKRKIECRTEQLRPGDVDNEAYTPPAHSSKAQASRNDPRQSLPSPGTTTASEEAQAISYNLGSSSNGETVDLDAIQTTQFQDDGDSNAWNIPDTMPLLPFPTFFEQIMAPDFVASDTMTMPHDFFNMMPDLDWSYDTTDIFGLDFTPKIDEALQTQTGDLNCPEQPPLADPTSNIGDSGADNARARHAIFQRSPWLWKPEANQNAFSEHNELPLDEQQISLGDSPHQPYMHSLTMQDILSQQSRDRIFQMVVKTAKSNVSIPSFPSAKCLGTLLKVGIAKRLETDAWIHPYTFDSDHTRPELLAALIGAGCVCFGIPSVSQTGLVLLEIARVALNRLLEDDNSVIRDLQYLQACMIWIDITSFSGFKRKMEIAESSLSQLVTALRRAGKFDRVAYTQIVPSMGDDGNAIELKWRKWVEQESYSRLVHHLFEHDMHTTIAKVRNPLISYAELSLPLPACRGAWLAPSPEQWHLTLPPTPQPTPTQPLSLRDLLSNPDLLHHLPPHIDSRLSHTLHLAGLAAQSWEHYQQTLLLKTPHATTEDPSSHLWLQTRHQKLILALKTSLENLHAATAPAVTAIFCEFLMMSLHVSPDEVTRFAGKCGEAEARRAFQALQGWAKTKGARVAVWHAAQVVRVARGVPPFQLRGADNFLIYHAVMVLWTFGMVRCGASVAGSGSGPADLPTVFLDEERTDGVEGFILMGTGRPCLHAESGGGRGSQSGRVCDLRQPRSVLAMGIAVFEANYPNEKQANLPQLVRSLCELMRELGSLR